MITGYLIKIRSQGVKRRRRTTMRQTEEYTQGPTQLAHGWERRDARKRKVTKTVHTQRDGLLYCTTQTCYNEKRDKQTTTRLRLLAGLEMGGTKRKTLCYATDNSEYLRMIKGY